MSEEWIKFYTRECVKGMPSKPSKRGWFDLVILLVVSVIIGVMI